MPYDSGMGRNFYGAINGGNIGGALARGMFAGPQGVPTDNPMPQYHGVMGFLDRMTNPTNPLGNIGMAMLIGGGGPAGQAGEMLMAQHRQKLMDAQATEASHAAPDPMNVNGHLIQQQGDGSYKELFNGQNPTGFDGDLQKAGIMPGTPEYKKHMDDYINNRTDGNVTTMTPNGFYTGPRSGLPGALGIAPPPTPVGPTHYKPGDVVSGMKFLGGDDGDQANWQSAGGVAPQGAGAVPLDSVMRALTQQESGGNGMAVSSAGAIGSTQMLPATARAMATKAGLPFDPNLLHSNDPAAVNYQQQLGQSYLQEGLDKTGNLRDALRYYHGGPNRAQWGPKTNAYADSILASLGKTN